MGVESDGRGEREMEELEIEGGDWRGSGEE